MRMKRLGFLVQRDFDRVRFEDSGGGFRLRFLGLGRRRFWLMILRPGEVRLAQFGD
jgi:hypothetical protein